MASLKAYIQSPKPSSYSTSELKLSIFVAAFFLLNCIYFISSDKSRTSGFHPGHEDFKYLRQHCANVPAVVASEFHARQVALAQALHRLGGAAYIVEPGANALYFANISQTAWHLSERPFLLIISPVVNTSGEVKPKITVLTPSFEASRARLLPIPALELSFVEWAEDESPYKAAVSSLSNGTIYIAEATRLFIKDGIEEAAVHSLVISAPQVIQSLRERKSSTELALLRCVNEVTLLAIREVRSKMYLGMRQSDASTLMIQALLAAGLSSPSALVLFGPNAALPHGGPSDRALKSDEFALFDVGAAYHGYKSDITRTFALESSKISPQILETWYLVHKAQQEALTAAKEGVIAHVVDERARSIIKEAGYGDYFTHRLGHGIGLEGHEAPYLRGGSMDVLQTGNTFSDEPGIYVPDNFGIRLEDCFVIEEDGSAVYLTKGVGGAARSPWDI